MAKKKSLSLLKVSKEPNINLLLPVQTKIILQLVEDIEDYLHTNFRVAHLDDPVVREKIRTGITEIILKKYSVFIKVKDNLK